MEEFSKQRLDAARDASFAAKEQEVELEESKRNEVGLEPAPGEDIVLETFNPGEKKYSPGHRGDIFDEATHYPQGSGKKSGLEIAKPGENKTMVDPNEDYIPQGEIKSGLELDLPN